MEFTINKNEVCINPVKELIVDDKNFKVYFSYASLDNVWTYGYHYEYKGSGVGCCCGGSGANFRKYSKQFASKELCRYAALSFLYKWLKERGDHPYGASINPVLESIVLKMNLQLELF